MYYHLLINYDFTYIIRYWYAIHLKYLFVVLESLKLHYTGPLGNTSDFGIVIL